MHACRKAIGNSAHNPLNKGCGDAGTRQACVMVPVGVLAVLFLALTYGLASHMAGEDAGAQAGKLLPDHLTVRTWPGTAAVVRLGCLVVLSYVLEPAAMAQEVAAARWPEAPAWKPPLIGSLCIGGPALVVMGFLPWWFRTSSRVAVSLIEAVTSIAFITSGMARLVSALLILPDSWLGWAVSLPWIIGLLGGTGGMWAWARCQTSWFIQHLVAAWACIGVLARAWSLTWATVSRAETTKLEKRIMVCASKPLHKCMKQVQ